MRLIGFQLAGVAVPILVLSVVGCGAPWRPPLDSVDTPPATQPVDLASCLRACRSGEWVYQRHALPEREAETRYVRRISRDLLSERSLADPPVPPLEEVLPATLPAERPPDKEKLAALPRTASLVMFELVDPLAPIPLDLMKTGPAADSTRIRYYDYRGRYRAEGTLKRVVEVEGVEDIECPAGRFTDCLRIRVDLTAHFPWLLWMDWTSYLWLSPVAGEVRRVHRFSGWFVIFWFSSTHEYELVSHVAGDPTSQEATRSASRSAGVSGGWVLDPPWSRGVLLLDGPFSRLEITGMAVEFAKPEP